MQAEQGKAQCRNANCQYAEKDVFKQSAASRLPSLRDLRSFLFSLGNFDAGLVKQIKAFAALNAPVNPKEKWTNDTTFTFNLDL